MKSILFLFVLLSGKYIFANPKCINTSIKQLCVSNTGYYELAPKNWRPSIFILSKLEELPNKQIKIVLISPYVDPVFYEGDKEEFAKYFHKTLDNNNCINNNICVDRLFEIEEISTDIAKSSSYMYQLENINRFEDDFVSLFFEHRPIQQTNYPHITAKYLFGKRSDVMKKIYIIESEKLQCTSLKDKTLCLKDLGKLKFANEKCIYRIVEIAEYMDNGVELQFYLANEHYKTCEHFYKIINRKEKAFSFFIQKVIINI